MAAAGVRRRAPRRPALPSLRLRVSVVVAALALLPNIAVLAGLLLPVGGEAPVVDPSLRGALVAWLVTLVVASVAIGYLMSRQLLLPLLDTTREVERLARRPRRLSAARVPVAGDEPDEVRVLKEAFNELLEQVATEQARRAAFTATLMHDLKTPLIAANHLLEVVRDDEALGREERVDLVGRITRENAALIDLVQKLVDAHRFERDEVELRLEPAAIEEVVRRVLERLRPLAEERGVQVRLRGEARGRVDPRELERALYNLLSNAVRYARREIAVEAFRGVVRIADDGPGLPASLEDLARPFAGRPVEIAGTTYTAGTAGLGLFVARRVLEAHGGRLVVESTGPRGTVLLAYYGSPA